MFLKVLAFVFLVPGVLLVFGSKAIVKKYELDKKVKTEFEDSMEEEELIQYKNNKAVVNVKMLGLLIALPGLALVLYAFR